MTLALNTIHVGDCRDLLKQMDDESVHCVVTSPPYYGLRDYGTARWDGGSADCDHRGPPMQSQRSTLAGNGHGNGKKLSPYLQEQGVPFRGACGKCGAVRIDSQLGLEATTADYVASMVEVFREVRRVLRPDGTLWLNVGDSYASNGGHADTACNDRRGAYNIGNRPEHDRRDFRCRGAGTLKPKDMAGIPWRVAFALQDGGWFLRSDIIWHKPNPMPEAVRDRPTKAHEYLFLLSKSPRYYYDAEAIKEPASEKTHSRGNGQSPKSGKNETSTDRRRAGLNERWKVKQNASFQAATLGHVSKRNKRTVWKIPTEPFAGAHFATFPRKLVEPCILAGCPVGGVVLDPFFGTGTVGQVAENLGRRWIGLELNPAYADLARVRTAQTGLLGRAPAAPLPAPPEEYAADQDDDTCWGGMNDEDREMALAQAVVAPEPVAPPPAPPPRQAPPPARRLRAFLVDADGNETPITGEEGAA